MMNVQAPKVSIIIPAYNTAAFMPECLSSIFAQTYSDFEAIVVNDGSPDTPALENVLAPYSDRVVYIKQENKRAAGARNTAIRRAQGEFLAFLDSDDSWLPEHLALQMELFRRDPTLDLVYADCFVTGGLKPWRFAERFPPQGEPTFCTLAASRCIIPVSTVVARKTAIVRAELFDENLQRCDDYDMWLRTAFHGAKIAYSRQVQARLSGRRPGSLGQDFSKNAEAHCAILEKAIRTLPLSESQRAVVNKQVMEYRAGYLLEEAKRRLRNGQFSKARELFCEANRHFRRPAVNLAVFALGIAPSATSKLIEAWSRIRNGASAES
jgi:glycosyltransferase involved in cell wall biosynthesis